MNYADWLFLAVIGLAFLWAWDRHLVLKEVEKDLKDYLGDILVASEAAKPEFRSIYVMYAGRLKHLIRTHFTL